MSTLDGDQLAQLTLTYLRRLYVYRIHVDAVVWDGANVNRDAASILIGAGEEERGYFVHPITQRHVAVLYDWPHLLKRIRNCLYFTKGGAQGAHLYSPIRTHSP